MRIDDTDKYSTNVLWDCLCAGARNQTRTTEKYKLHVTAMSYRVERIQAVQQPSSAVRSLFVCCRFVAFMQWLYKLYLFAVPQLANGALCEYTRGRHRLNQGIKFS